MGPSNLCRILLKGAEQISALILVPSPRMLSVYSKKQIYKLYNNLCSHNVLTVIHFLFFCGCCEIIHF